jgi:leucyl/phenylalanyl-tRNA---protein transferase
MKPHQKLDAQTLIAAYTQGYFPMQDPDSGLIQWYSADPRGILPLDQFHCPQSLARRYRSNRFVITSNHCFTQVMHHCARVPRKQGANWIAPEMIQAYTQLHNHGLAHSIEAWLPADTNLPIHQLEQAHTQILHATSTPHILVGGLYGVHLGSIFFGESMFHRATDASRVCLVHLVEHLKKQTFSLLEIQAVNEHTAQFGAQSIPAAQYLKRLKLGLKKHANW